MGLRNAAVLADLWLVAPVGVLGCRLALPGCGSPDSSGSGWMVGSGRQRDGRDAGESGEEVIDPGPVGGQPEVSASGAAGQSGRYVQQSVAQSLGFGGDQRPGQREQA